MTEEIRPAHVALDATAQLERAAVLLNAADAILAGKPRDELLYDEREHAYHLTVLADTRVQLARALENDGGAFCCRGESK